ncbi:hypothetical protein BDZ90DRAFT_23678 [Jaminaea rosea]|uniref:Uncharacterized protein n=1 Tax=Jaminaea rosea TaxID=1569628 RepID=A0A316V3J2_9BASI|nr:hypothetical protein BDZ90DRAFT_23678 [Jaminaea rosea]PWN30763.1 hypothetical protein BDZ90DRAFT_23678 [Jaminaea rosea]
MLQTPRRSQREEGGHPWSISRVPVVIVAKRPTSRGKRAARSYACFAPLAGANKTSSRAGIASTQSILSGFKILRYRRVIVQAPFPARLDSARARPCKVRVDHCHFVVTRGCSPHRLAACSGRARRASETWDADWRLASSPASLRRGQLEMATRSNKKLGLSR